MDESMIQEFFDNDGNLVKFVTHADYRALDERHQALLSAIAKGNALADRTNKIDRHKVIGMAILNAMKDWS